MKKKTENVVFKAKSVWQRLEGTSGQRQKIWVR